MLILVLPFCTKDGDLALQNLRWIAELDPHLPFDCILSHDTETPKSLVAQMAHEASSVFRSVKTIWYPAPQKKYWPAAPNCAFQNVARYMAHYHKGCHWLFLEADATPIRSGWLQQLEAEYVRGGRPFMGHVVHGMGHANGCMVYPSDVAAYSYGAMMVDETAWDVVLGKEVDKALIHPANDIIRHCWNMDERTGLPTNGHGYSPTFKSVHDVVSKVDMNAALYHRCKDGSLIHWLREHYKAPHKAMVPQHTQIDEPEKQSADQDVQRVDTAVSAPVVQPSDHSQPATQASAFTGRCEILIVTYAKDEPWLRWALRAIRKFCTGFTGITLVIPGRDADAFRDVANTHAQAKSSLPLKIKLIKEPPGKGMLAHMAVMGSADEFVPKDTTHVMHVDSDVIFNMPVTPADYIHGTKPVYVWRTYASLAEVRDGQKVVSDCAQWKAPTEAQLGFPTNAYTMCRHPSCFPIGFYKPYRQHIEKQHGRDFFSYMTSGRNEHPANRMDFTAMGAWAFAKMHDAFEWLDISGGNHLAPKDRQQTYWSHGGITPTIQKEIEEFLK